MKIAPADTTLAEDEKNWKVYRQTVAIPTANRLMNPATTSTSGSTSGSGSTTGNSSGSGGGQ
jgi:hypothetical protein